MARAKSSRRKFLAAVPALAALPDGSLVEIDCIAHL
jgi:hypothetical protein